MSSAVTLERSEIWVSQVMVIILSLGQETSAVLGAETEAAGQLHGGNKYI